ncbi:hypothetical protein [Nitrobacter sp.]|uniref:hypothetical protein n=1 Tax=Nitrobacter sp. TaxID=29420 RepID=UPI0029CAC6E2|nr:hypothetical protein [Nitrobacter sp.]
MSASTVSAEDMRSTLRHVAMNRMIAVMAVLRLEPPCGILISALETAPESSEAERRIPMMLTIAEAAAELIGYGCNSWPDGEREAVMERVLAHARKSFADSKEKVDGWMAPIDPLRTMRRATTTETGKS